MKRISIIIPTLNRTEDLARCLESVLAQTLLPSEVIVVDQSDDSRTRELVETYRQKTGEGLPEFVYVHRDERSSARARNYGASLAHGDLLSFTDDDIILHADYLANIIKYFDDSQIGGVMGNVDNPICFIGFKGRLRQIVLYLFLLNNFRGKLTISGFGYPVFERQVNKTTEVELFPGFSMTFRRELFLKEKFDDWFSGYSFREDVDLSYRISRSAKLLLIPDARFFHNHSKANRTDPLKLKVMQFKNYYYVFNKLKNNGFFSQFLFSYSLVGLIILDFISLVCEPKNNAKLNDFLGNFKVLYLCLFPKLQKN